MARSIPAASLAKIAQNLGTEPINIIEIEWVDGQTVQYADRDISNIVKGKILEISDLDDVIAITKDSTSQQINLTLSDADGELKGVFDAHDIHKRPCWVYQWFEGLSLDDKFLVFKGQISSPITWNESARTVSFDIITQIEDKETGFSPEEGQFPEIPSDLIGVPWPMAFGTVIDMPTVGINKAISGTTQQGVGIVSGRDLASGVFTGDNSDEIAFEVAMIQLSVQSSVMAIAAQRFRNAASSLNQGPGSPDTTNFQATYESLLERVNQISRQRAIASAQFDEAQADQQLQVLEQFNALNAVEGPDTIRILGGEDFPQGVPVCIQIGGGEFTGVFNCQEFRIMSRSHPENEQAAQDAYDISVEVEVSQTGGGKFDVSTTGPYGEIIRHHGSIITPPIVRRADPGTIMKHFWAEAGSSVTLCDDSVQNYIVSIVPGTVKTVKAYKQFEGVKRLVNVPNNLWSQVNRAYGLPTGDVATVQLTKRLSGIEDGGWDDDVFVIFESSIGPNTVNIMEWLIQHYSSLTTDTASFDAVRAYLAPFPSHFAIFDRRQVISLLKDIAFQARCALYIKNDKFYLKYLPVQPATEATITESDVVHQTLTVDLTPTEDLVTKMDVTWRPTYAPEVEGQEHERKLILRHNVAKYGIQEESYDWFIYAQPDIIRKAATFWMIRLSNTWKRMRFQSKLNLLNVETLDAVSLNFAGNFAADATFTGLVENATYNSADRSIDFEILTPVKAGTMVPYTFFWPFVAVGQFPTADDLAGGAGIGIQADGILPTGSIGLGATCVDGNGIFIGGPNIIYSGPADRGDPTPADTNFVAQDRIIANTDFTVDPGEKPNPDLLVKKRIRVSPPALTAIPSYSGIDIRKTMIYDSDTNVATTLDTVFREINVDNGLVIDVDATVGDAADNRAVFDFKYDSDGEKFGAGTAFLQDD